MRLLVVEDEPTLAGAIAEWLRAGAHAVDVAARAHRVAGAARRGQGAGRRLRHHAGAARPLLRRAAALHHQRLARAAHPLTVGRALVELAVHRPAASADAVRLGEDLLRVNARHERLIAGLLLLATSENGPVQRRPADLADVAAHVLAQCAGAAAAAGVTLLEDLAEAPVAGDGLLLERLAYNLVENGIRHNSGAGGWVRVTTRAGARIEVGNTGPVVPAHEVPALFAPFHRLGDGGGAARSCRSCRA